MNILQLFYGRAICKGHVSSSWFLVLASETISMRSHQVYCCYVPYIQATFSCPILLPIQDIPSRIIGSPSQQFRAAATGQVRTGFQFLCKTKLLHPGFRISYYYTFNEKESGRGRLIRDCASQYQAWGYIWAAHFTFLCYIYWLLARLVKDSSLIMLSIHNSLKLRTPAVPKSGPIFCKWSISYF